MLKPPVGTRSVLYGAHCWFIHPWFVAAAWTKLYGFPLDLRIWVAFLVHDLGYWGKPNMDGPEGERHVQFGASLMHRLFDVHCGYEWYSQRPRSQVLCDDTREHGNYCYIWRDLCLYHSRFYAKRDGVPYSRLCVADKLAICLTPWWLYVPMAMLTGEWREYIKEAETGKYKTMNLDGRFGLVAWYRSVQCYLLRWVEEHKDGRPDTWTPEARDA